MRVEIESLDTSKQAQHVERTIDLDRRRSPVGGYGRTQAKAVLDRRSEPGQQRSREAAETLAWGNAGVAMVQVLGNLSVFSLLSCRVRGFPDVMVRTHEDQMIGTIEEAPDRLDFRLGRRLTGSKGVEADNHDGVGFRNQRIDERCFDLSLTRSIWMMGLPVSASACSAKAAKFGFWIWSRNPPIP